MEQPSQAPPSPRTSIRTQTPPGPTVPQLQLLELWCVTASRLILFLGCSGSSVSCKRPLREGTNTRQRALNEEDRSQPLHCSLSRATCRTSCPPPPFDRDPHHALVRSLQLLELLLQHQAAAQNLAVLLVTLTDASAATAQLEGEGVFLFIDLRQLRRQILSQELKHFCDSKTVFHVTEGKNSIENVGAATVPLSKVLQQQLVARSPAQVALKHPHDVQDCSLLLSSLPELNLWKWLT